MATDRNAFKLGVTILLFLAIFAGVLVFLAPRGGGDLTLRVRFPHREFTTTLKAGSEVVCGGQTVGSIRSIDLVDMDGPQPGSRNLYAVMRVKLDSGLGLRQDCTFVPEGPLLGGPGRLLILDRGVGEPLQANQMVEGKVMPDIGRVTRLLGRQLDPDDPAGILAMLKAQLDANDRGSLAGKMHTLLDDLSAVTHRLGNELDPQQKELLFGKLHAVLDRLNEATGLIRAEADAHRDGAAMSKMHQALDTLNSGLKTAIDMLDQNKAPLNEAIVRFRSAGEILERDVAVRLAAQLDPADTASLLAKMHVAIDRLGVSLRDINDISAHVGQFIAMNKDQINGLVANFKETSDHLKAASKEIRRSPWRLFYQPTMAESAEANIHDAARAFSDAATKLDDAVMRLESMSKHKAATPLEEKQLQDLAEQLNLSFQNFSKAESALWEQLKIR